MYKKYMQAVTWKTDYHFLEIIKDKEMCMLICAGVSQHSH